MDRLSIFAPMGEVSLKSEENNTIDTIADKLADVERELKITRKGHEEWTWGEEVEDSDIDLEEVE